MSTRDPDHMHVSLQEAILSLLTFDDVKGSMIAAQVSPDHFEGMYRDAAVAILGYRKRYGKAPGRTHLPTLLEGLGGPGQARVTKQIIETLSSSEGLLNVDYVAGRGQEFVRTQTLKAAVYEATDMFVSGETDGLVTTVEDILYKSLRAKQQTLSAGTFLDDPVKALSFLINQPDLPSLGIPILKSLGIGFGPKELLLYIAPKGTGKTWFAINCGRFAAMQKLRVAHISLEMSEERVVRRYYQAFFAISRKPDSFERAVFELDNMGRFTRFKKRMETPELNFRHPKIEQQLRHLMKIGGTQIGNINVKDFPTGTLTMGQLYAHLDYLEMVERFIPHVLIVDYPDLMAVDSDNYRHGLDSIYKDLRGLGAERNMTVIAPTQGNRVSLTARNVGSHMVAEDVRKINTADNVLAYSQTPEEHEVGLARLRVEHARDVETGLQIVISQSYATGQFCREAAMVNDNYRSQMEREHVE